MRIYVYREKGAKRTQRQAFIPKDECEQLLKISNEWKLIEVKGDLAVFKAN